MISKMKKGVKNLSAFTIGMLIGVVYGSAVATLVTVSMVGLP
jgi:hypothetical protein